MSKAKESKKEKFEEKMESIKMDKPILLPKDFIGQTSIADWLDEYEVIAGVNGWEDTEKARMLPAFLKGGALLWYKRNYDIKEWRKLKIPLTHSHLLNKKG